jgi:predicted small secreted protein
MKIIASYIVSAMGHYNKADEGCQPWTGGCTTASYSIQQPITFW